MKHVKKQQIIWFAAIAIGAVAFVPGSGTTFINATDGTIGIQCITTTKSYQKTIALAAGSRVGLSGDYGALISLSITYAGGGSLHLDRQQLTAREDSAQHSHGVWWIDHSSVRVISAREANIAQRKLLHGAQQ